MFPSPLRSVDQSDASFPLWHYSGQLQSFSRTARLVGLSDIGGGGVEAALSQFKLLPTPAATNQFVAKRVNCFTARINYSWKESIPSRKNQFLPERINSFQKESILSRKNQFFPKRVNSLWARINSAQNESILTDFVEKGTRKAKKHQRINSGGYTQILYVAPSRRYRHISTKHRNRNSSDYCDIYVSAVYRRMVSKKRDGLTPWGTTSGWVIPRLVYAGEPHGSSGHFLVSFWQRESMPPC